jgi:hypothetical protein
MTALPLRSHAATCVSFWRWALVGVALGLAWATLGPIGLLLMLALLIGATAFRPRVVTPAVFGVLTGFGVPLLWIGAGVPAQRAPAWYAVGAGLAVVGAVAFAAGRRPRSR